MIEDSKASIEFENFLKSIGGLENGYFTDRDPMFSRRICSVDDGWLPLIKKLIEDLIEVGWNKQITQIKEKFGGLRFYISGGNDEIYKLISKAEEESYTICEVCGKLGKPNNEGWIKTTCEEHKG